MDATAYAREYQRSLDDPEGFWGEVGQRLDWMQPFSRIKNVSYQPEDFRIRCQRPEVVGRASR